MGRMYTAANAVCRLDDSLALVDYESTYADTHKIKYLNYIVRTLKRTMEQHHFSCKIRMIVIYTADIQP